MQGRYEMGIDRARGLQPPFIAHHNWKFPKIDWLIIEASEGLTF